MCIRDSLEGTVVKMDFVNPHSWLYLDVKGPDGQIQHWSVEGGAPGVLLRNGWTRNTLPEGTKIIVHGFMSVSYTHLRAHETGRNIVCRLLLEKKKLVRS